MEEKHDGSIPSSVPIPTYIVVLALSGVFSGGVGVSSLVTAKGGNDEYSGGNEGICRAALSHSVEQGNTLQAIRSDMRRLREELSEFYQTAYTRAEAQESEKTGRVLRQRIVDQLSMLGERVAELEERK